MAQNNELRLQTGISTPSSGVAKLWVDTSGVVKITSSAGNTTIVGGGMKVYKALISQDGSSSVPTAIVIENTLSTPVIFARSSTGTYTLTSTGSFSSNKTFINSPNLPTSNEVDSEWFARARYATANSIVISTFNINGQPIDGFNNLMLNVEVYP